MSRRFAFRAWNNKKKEWQHKMPCDLFGEMILLGGWMEGVRLQDLNEIVAMQFTGILDKNGKEIYEGDILHDCEVEFGANYIVKYEPAFFAGYDTNTARKMYLHGFRFCKCEIIGNIFDNPELKDEDSAALGTQPATVAAGEPSAVLQIDCHTCLHKVVCSWLRNAERSGCDYYASQTLAENVPTA